MSQGEGIYTRSPADGPLLQGEILSNLPQARLAIEAAPSEGQGVFDIKVHPWVIVMSQDCDLEQDFHAGPGRMSPNILFCEMSTADDLSALIRTSGLGSSKWQLIRQNNDPRYHFLQRSAQEDDARDNGLEEFGIDFKRHFTLPTEEVYFRLHQETQRRCVLNSPYLEHLANRFYAFMSRVALPAEHQSE